MGADSRRKGIAGQSEAARHMAAHGWAHVYSTQGAQAGASPVVDLEGDRRCAFECKRHKKVTPGEILSAWHQAAREDHKGRVPVVVWRSDRQPWQATLDAIDFFVLIEMGPEYRGGPEHGPTPRFATLLLADFCALVTPAPEVAP